MTATEAHLSGWLSHELGEWRRMRVLVSKLGGGLRASSLPAPIIWKPQSYMWAFPSFRTLWALLAFLPSSQKDNKRPSLSQWAAQTPLSSPHLHLTGFGNCRFLVWAKSPQGYKRCLKHASLSQPAQKGKVNRNGWMEGSQTPKRTMDRSPGRDWWFSELHKMIFIWNLDEEEGGRVRGWGRVWEGRN